MIGDDDFGVLISARGRGSKRDDFFMSIDQDPLFEAGLGERAEMESGVELAVFFDVEAEAVFEVWELKGFGLESVCLPEGLSGCELFGGIVQEGRAALAVVGFEACLALEFLDVVRPSLRGVAEELLEFGRGGVDVDRREHASGCP